MMGVMVLYEPVGVFCFGFAILATGGSTCFSVVVVVVVVVLCFPVIAELLCCSLPGTVRVNEIEKVFILL